MPLFKTCAVALTGNKEVYRKGEQVAGGVMIDVTENVSVKGVRVYLYGESLAKWSEFSPGTLGGTEDHVGKEKYFGLVITLFGNKQNEPGPVQTLTAGQHRYTFKFNLPSSGKLPSSYEGENGGVRYWLKVEVHRPFPSINQTWYRGITVMDDLNVTDTKYRNPVKRTAKKQISKALGFGNAGTLTLNASVDRGAYAAGEKIAISAVVSNETSKDMGKLKAQIVQRVVFTAKGEKKIREQVIRVLEGATPIAAGQERVWKDQLMEVDPIPPSTVAASCTVINVSYTVKVFVEVPLAFNLETKIPITIGTIPYGVAAVNVQRAASTPEGDPSSPVFYTKCIRGVQTCHKSDGNFSNYNYVPMCTYRRNYVFPPPQPVRTAAAARPATTAAQRAAGARPKTTAQTPGPAAQTQTPRPAAAQAPRPVAPAAAGKAPLPPATVHVPAPGLAPVAPAPMSAFRPPAPPLMPPSYDDVLAMSIPPPAAAATPAAPSPASTSPKQEKADKPYGLLVLRFPDSHIQEFRDTIAIEGRNLAQCRGDIMAVAPQPMIRENPENWPGRTSVAILMFPTVEAATDWFTKTPRVADPNWLGKCDAFVGTMFEQYKEKNKLFLMSKVRQRKAIAKATLTKFNSMYTKHLRPLRLKKTGISLLNGKQHKMLRGDWLVDGTSYSISQWQDMDKLFEYKMEQKVGPCKEAQDLLEEVFEVRDRVMFQSEDLTPYNISLSQPAERLAAPPVEVNHPPPPASAPPLPDEPALPSQQPIGTAVAIQQPDPPAYSSTSTSPEHGATPTNVLEVQEPQPISSDQPNEDRSCLAAPEQSRPTAIALEDPQPRPNACGPKEGNTTSSDPGRIGAHAVSTEDDPATTTENLPDQEQNVEENNVLNKSVLVRSVSVEQAISVPTDDSEDQTESMEPVEETQEESAATFDDKHDEDDETENCDLQEQAEAVATESPDETEERGRTTGTSDDHETKELHELGGQFDDADDEDEDEDEAEAALSDATGDETVDVKNEAKWNQNEASSNQNEETGIQNIQNEAGVNKNESVEDDEANVERGVNPKKDKQKKQKRGRQREAVPC